MDVNSFLEAETSCDQPPNMAHLPPMPELKRIQRPLVKKTSKAKRQAKQPVQSMRPAEEPSFVEAMSAASREVPDVPMLLPFKDQPVSAPEVPVLQRTSDYSSPSPQEIFQQPSALRRVSDSQTTSPSERYPQPSSRYERLQQPMVPSKVSDYPAPSSHERFHQPSVPLKVSDHRPPPYGRLQQLPVSQVSDHPPPPYDRLQQPPVPQVSDHLPPPYGRLQQLPVSQRVSDHLPPPYGRLQHPPVFQKVSDHPPPPYGRMQQPPVSQKVSDHPPPPYDRLQQRPVSQKLSDPPPQPYDRLQQPPVSLTHNIRKLLSRASNPQAPTPCERPKPPKFPWVSDWSQQPPEQQRVSRSQAPMMPMASRPKAQVWPMASNSQVPVSAQTQSSYVWSRQPQDSNLQVAVPSKFPSPQPPVPSARSQQVSVQVSNPHAPSPWKTLHQSPVLSSEWSQHSQVLTKVSGPQMPVLPRVTNHQVPVLSSVSDPRALSPCKRFQQPPELSSEWSQQVSPVHPDPPLLSFQCVVEELQKISDPQMPSSHERLKYSPVISKTPLESVSVIASGKSRQSNFISQPSAPYFDNASKQNQPRLHHDLKQNAFIKQQSVEPNYVMQHVVQQYYHQSVEQAHQKLNYQHPNQPVLSDIYGYRRQDSSLQSFPQLTPGYHRGAAVPCSVSDCRTCMYYMKMTQHYGQKKHIPIDGQQHILQHGQSSYCQPWHNQYNNFQENLNIYKYQQQMQHKMYQQQMQHKMQNKLLTPPNQMECVQQGQQLNYDHRINERTQPFLGKPLQHHMKNALEQTQQPQTQQKHPTREQENGKPLMQIDSERYQQLRDQPLLCSKWHVNPFFQQKDNAHQNINTVVKEADTMLTTQIKDGQKESVWQTPDHCTDNPKNLVSHASHKVVEIYSQESKIEVTKHSMSKAEAKEQISEKITNSPTFAQTATMNVACQLSPPATPIDLRKAKEHKTDEYPGLQSSVKADLKMAKDQRLFKMSYDLIHKDSPQRVIPESRSLSNTEHETCNEYTSSTQNSNQAVKEHTLVAGHISGAIPPPKGLSVPSSPTQIPTIFSQTPPPTPPEQLFPEWNETVTDDQRKRAVIENDIQECTSTSTRIAEDAAKKHSIESSAIPQTEISHQSIECPPVDCNQPIHVISQPVSREQEKNPKMHMHQDLSSTQVISNKQSPLLLGDVSQSASVIASEKYSVENCSPVQQKDIVITESEQKTNQKAATKSKLHLNIPRPEKQLLPSEQKNQTQDIAGPPIANSHMFAKQETPSVGDSRCSVVSDKEKHKTISKDNLVRSSKMYDCLGSVHFISRCYRTKCFVCNKEVAGKNVINHMFFPHLKCRNCKTIIKSCHDYSMLKKRLRKGKLKSCSSVSGCHNFDRWNVSPVDFLTYRVRKLIAFRGKRSYNNQPTEQEVTDEMETYIKKLLMLQFLNPWKSAIRSCKKYIDALKQTKSESNKQGKKRKRAEDPEKENSIKRGRKKSNINVPKPILRTLSETSNTISNTHESSSLSVEPLESTSLDRTTNRSEGTMVIQEQGTTGATTEKTVRKVPSILMKVIQEPSLAKVNGEPQAKEPESSVDVTLPEYGDDYLLNACDMDMLDKMTTYVSLSDGP
ncbi:uncharacterized protein LOC125034154 [Penaeus chinensis]|uniref:uncharacterized protein LOC125034154 n=1 Tax=Penaeus chinensis TaxID=139456 RepID=UPI001FB56EBC|nr:uncharacterized protein LOC125034154 [Penaeus chinensis]